MKKYLESGETSHIPHHITHLSAGISLISLIITIIVIIILAAIVIFTGLNTPDRANFAKFAQNFSDFQTAVSQDYMQKKAEYAIERKTRSIFRLIVPPLTVSTCSLRHQTAGSAQTIIAPRRRLVNMSRKVQTPPFVKARAPNDSPRTLPVCINPPYTPVRKTVSPIKL